MEQVTMIIDNKKSKIVKSIQLCNNGNKWQIYKNARDYTRKYIITKLQEIKAILPFYGNINF